MELKKSASGPWMWEQLMVFPRWTEVIYLLLIVSELVNKTISY